MKCVELHSLLSQMLLTNAADRTSQCKEIMTQSNPRDIITQSPDPDPTEQVVTFWPLKVTEFLKV